MSDASILEIVDIFQDLNPDQLNLIYNICYEKVCSRGTVIVKENTPTTEMYVILEGQMEVLIGIDRDGHPKEKRVALLESGQSFGEVALVDQGLRSATVRCAAETCRLFEISRADLLKLLKEHTDIGFIVMFNLASDLCLKFRNATARL